MKKLISWMMVGAFFLAIFPVWADESMGNMKMDSGTAMATPAPKAKVKKAKVKAVTKVKVAKKKAAKQEVKEVWVCPMGHYSGPKTADGKCPTCGMDLEKKASAPEKK